MYKDKKIVGLIPARGGSKGIPHKNIIDLCGKPLISYTIEAGKNSRYIDNVMISTDDEEIACVSRTAGGEVPFMRPAELASDTAKTVDVVVHALRMFKEQGRLFDTLVLLQPTQPLRNSEDIDKAIEMYMASGCKPLASINIVDDHPLLIRSISQGVLTPLLNTSSTCRRQDMPPFYRINGCIYINEVSSIDALTSFNDNAVPFIMDKSHSVDIDEYKDLEVAEYYIRKYKA